MKFIFALWLGKITIYFTRLFGWGGTSLPGSLARKIDPAILTRLANQVKGEAAVITGTNGKTTTAKMLSQILKTDGRTVTHNRAGANLIGGITTAFIAASNLGGRLGTQGALVEADEATMPAVTAEIRPKAVVVTNFFRDQLDRFGELDKTVSLIRTSLSNLPPEATLLLNADDPLVAGLGQGSPYNILYYGIEDESLGRKEMTQTAEAKYCVLCGAHYEYEIFYYGQLGKYFCPRCKATRPEPQVKALSLTPLGEEGSQIRIATPKGEFDVHLKLPGLYNVYNALAATACALALDVPLDSIAAGLSQFSTNFGRMELIDLGDKKVFIALIKNPVGCDEVLRTLAASPTPKHLLVLINDNAADGRDISWLWDADFEILAPIASQLRSISTGGLRGEDMAMRLKYAGLPGDKITLEKDIPQALAGALSRLKKGETLYVLPTYTSLLEAKEALQKMGHSAHYWEE